MQVKILRPEYRCISVRLAPLTASGSEKRGIGRGLRYTVEYCLGKAVDIQRSAHVVGLFRCKANSLNDSFGPQLGGSLIQTLNNLLFNMVLVLLAGIISEVESEVSLPRMIQMKQTTDTACPSGQRPVP